LTTWYVQEGSKVQELDEDKLRKLLREDELHGVELARRRDETEWRPLHDYQIFGDEVPHTGDAASAARQRQLVSFAGHLAVYIIVNTIFSFWWPLTLFWGLALLGHANRTFPAAMDWFRKRTEGELAAPQAAAPIAEPEPCEEPPDAYLAELEAAIEALDLAIGEHTGEPEHPDLDAIRGTALTLHEQRLALETVANDDAMARLEAELKEAQHHIDDDDERGAEIYEAQATAIIDRLDNMKDAAMTADRLRARERTLLHQLEGTRMDLLRVQARKQPIPVLGNKLARVRDELEAESEVEEKLAQARRAAQRKTI